VTTVDGWRAPGLPVPPSEELTDAIAAIRSAYDMLLGVSPEHLCDDDVVRLLDAGVECQARATAVVVAAAGEADRRSLGDASGARTTGSWWAHRSRLTPASAGRTVSTARLLTDDLHAPVRDALAAGSIHADQASVIARAVEAIPTHADQLPADPEPPGVLKARARDHLLGEAARLDAAALHVLGRRILQVVAPAICEAAEAKALEDEEAEAARKVKLRLREDGHGSIHGRFTIPQAAGEALRKQLLALADPTRADISASGVGDDPSEGIGDRPRPLHVRLGWALIEWVERYPAGALPTTGGVGATAVVTMSLETLRGGLGAASLDTGTRVSPGEARRLACEAGIVPVVLGGRSEPLDVGRAQRFHTKAQRIAMGVRDGGCTAEGCRMPPAACHAHHDRSWSTGGRTDTESGRLLCHRHHRVIHDPRYETTYLATGKVTFHRRS
jgi:hypothetical protein